MDFLLSIIEWFKGIGGGYLTLAAIVLNIWKEQLKSKAEARKLRQQLEFDKQKSDKDAADKADLVKKEAELEARRVRERLETTLEEERRYQRQLAEQQHKDMRKAVHDMNDKVQMYVNEIALYKQQAIIDKREVELLNETMEDLKEHDRRRDVALKELQDKVQDRDQENMELRRKAAELQKQVDDLEQEVQKFRIQQPREKELLEQLTECRKKVAEYEGQLSRLRGSE